MRRRGIDMKPEGAYEFDIAMDFSQVALEEALEVLSDKARGKKILDTKLLAVGLGCDLLSVIDLSREFGLRPFFKKEYDADEWAVHYIDGETFKHIVLWSPGA